MSFQCKYCGVVEQELDDLVLQCGQMVDAETKPLPDKECFCPVCRKTTLFRQSMAADFGTAKNMNPEEYLVCRVCTVFIRGNVKQEG